MDLLTQTYKLFKEIANKTKDGFSGIGLIAYDPDCFNASNHCDLRPHIKSPNYNIYDHKICEYLMEISDYKHPLHDGFHFIDHNGILTHVAQYFVPAIVNDLSPDQEHGVRLYSSICGSTLAGVLFIGTICSNGEIYIFKSGENVDIENMLLEARK